jgi:hypothetical protein
MTGIKAILFQTRWKILGLKKMSMITYNYRNLLKGKSE